MRRELVDDEPTIRQMLTAVMTRLDWEVTTAATGEEAVETAAAESFDALVIDKNLPGIDGVEAGSRIREMDPDVEIVFVTGYSDVPLEELLEVDAFDEDIAEELRAVHRALGEIVGEISSDALLGEIFSNFCIGK